jgi:hypothetical protein
MGKNCRVSNGTVNHYTYLTQDGEGCFKFEFYQTDHGYEIDIVSKPKYLRTKSLNTKYILKTSSRNGRQQLIFNSQEPPSSFDQVCQHAEDWAESAWCLKNRGKKICHHDESGDRSSIQRVHLESDRFPKSQLDEENVRMVFNKEAFDELASSVGSMKPETGGILLGFRTDYVVRKFIFDEKGSFSPSGYDPNVDYLNPFLKSEWHENRYELIGFVHSHPRGACRLSGDWGNGYGDLGYLKRIFENINGLYKFLVPIVFSEFDGKPFQMIPFIAWKDSVKNYKEGVVEILNEENSKHDERC